MKVLIVSATKFEIQPLLNVMASVRNPESSFIFCTYKNLEVDFLVTGVGMVATAYYSAKAINDSYDIAFNMGICGSFNRNLELGDVVNVTEDCISEMGAQDDESFLSLDDLKLEGITKISNDKYGALNQVMELIPKVNGITVNTVHGSENAIAKVFEKFHPYVESMEGAAFMFACEQEGIPYMQVRAVSNYVEKRNREGWNISLAIENLNKKMLEILDSI